MGKRSLRPGELVTVCQSVEEHGALMLSGINDTIKTCVGRFRFGIFLALARGIDTSSHHSTTYAYVLDSASCRAGWCRAKLIRRPNAPEDG